MVLPLEPVLMRFLHRNWRHTAEVADLRQETYIRVYETACRKRPDPVKPYVLLVARNLIIDRLRHKNVVAIENVADAEWLNISDLEPAPEQRVAARQELMRLQAALESLPPRCRQVILLRRVQGYSQREVAQRMGIKEETVESQIVKGMRALTDAMSDRRGSLVTGARRFWIRKDGK
jgi:RNA polymerase sigma-70 factor (ECF subfamily)